MKIKVFRFKVSNWSSSAFEDDKKHSDYKQAQNELVSEAQIEYVVNGFIKNKQNVSIMVTPVDVHYHNNGRGNDIELVYTIMYQ